LLSAPPCGFTVCARPPAHLTHLTPRRARSYIADKHEKEKAARAEEAEAVHKAMEEARLKELAREADVQVRVACCAGGGAGAAWLLSPAGAGLPPRRLPRLRPPSSPLQRRLDDIRCRMEKMAEVFEKEVRQA
jgi:hypothetical protein